MGVVHGVFGEVFSGKSFLGGGCSRRQRGAGGPEMGVVAWCGIQREVFPRWRAFYYSERSVVSFISFRGCIGQRGRGPGDGLVARATAGAWHLILVCSV